MKTQELKAIIAAGARTAADAAKMHRNQKK